MPLSLRCNCTSRIPMKPWWELFLQFFARKERDRPPENQDYHTLLARFCSSVQRHQRRWIACTHCTFKKQCLPSVSFHCILHQQTLVTSAKMRAFAFYTQTLVETNKHYYFLQNAWMLPQLFVMLFLLSNNKRFWKLACII